MPVEPRHLTGHDDEPAVLILRHEAPERCKEVVFGPQNTAEQIIDNQQINRINVIRSEHSGKVLVAFDLEKGHLDEIFTINVLYLGILAVSEESI